MWGSNCPQWVESLAPDRRARVRGSPGEKLPCTLMAHGACKIRRGCNVLQVPIQIIPLEVPQVGESSSPQKIKIVMACLRTILRDESLTVGSRLPALLQSNVKPYLPTYHQNIENEPVLASVSTWQGSCFTIGLRRKRGFSSR